MPTPTRGPVTSSALLIAIGLVACSSPRESEPTPTAKTTGAASPAQPSPSPDPKAPALTPAPTNAFCGGLDCTPAATLDALCDRLLTAYSEQLTLIPDEEGETSRPTCKAVATREVDTGDLKGIAQLQIASPDTEQEVYHHLALKLDAGWLPAASIAYIYNPGMGGISEEGEVAFALKDVFPGGAEEVVVDAHTKRVDSDMGVAEIEVVERSQRVVCELITPDGASSPSPVCYGPFLLEYDASRTFEADLAEGTDLKPPPNLPDISRYKAETRFHPPGHVTVKVATRERFNDKALKSMNALTDGVHEVRKLPALKGL